MKRVMTFLLVVAIGAPMVSGCIIDNRRRGGPAYARSCPPAHHWEGGACVHNGRARGHYK